MLFRLTLIIVMVFALAIPMTAEAHHTNTYDKSCLQKYAIDARQTQCFIKRAAEHFRQSVSAAKYTAWCESRNNPFAVSSAGYKGLYQYDWTTWYGAPWGHKSIWSVRYQALNTMWYWARGQYSRWPNCT